MTARTHWQSVTRTKEYVEYGHEYKIVVEIRHDDRCNNGHNTFSITATIFSRVKSGRWLDVAFGCLHDEVAKHFPDLADPIKYHLTSTDGPLHYIENTLYHLGFSSFTDTENLQHARSTAVWPDMPESMLASNGADRETVRATLEARLREVLVDFRKTVEGLGLVY